MSGAGAGKACVVVVLAGRRFDGRCFGGRRADRGRYARPLRHDLRYEDLPPDVVRTAKRTLLDTVGCAIGGYTAEPSQIAIKLAAT